MEEPIFSLDADLAFAIREGKEKEYLTYCCDPGYADWLNSPIKEDKIIQKKAKKFDDAIFAYFTARSKAKKKKTKRKR